MKKLMLNKFNENKEKIKWSKNLNALKRSYGLKNFIFKLLKRKYGSNINFVPSGLTLKNFNELEQYTLNKLSGKELKRINKKRLQFLKSTKSYRSVRLVYGLPCRGQRTRTNAKTTKRFKSYKQQSSRF
jgi:ribosomal protein S13